MDTLIFALIFGVGAGIWNGSRYVKYDWEEFFVGFIAGFLGVVFWWSVFDALSGIISCNCSCP